MTLTYRPRRQSTRWLDGDCPAGVLAIYDNGGTGRRNGSVDRYTVLYVPGPDDVDHHGDVWIQYLATSEDPTRFGGHDGMPWHQARAYRGRVSHRAARWSDLPDAVKDVVRRDLTEYVNA